MVRNVPLSGWAPARLPAPKPDEIKSEREKRSLKYGRRAMIALTWDTRTSNNGQVPRKPLMPWSTIALTSVPGVEVASSQFSGVAPRIGHGGARCDGRASQFHRQRSQQYSEIARQPRQTVWRQATRTAPHPPIGLRGAISDGVKIFLRLTGRVAVGTRFQDEDLGFRSILGDHAARVAHERMSPFGRGGVQGWRGGR